MTPTAVPAGDRRSRKGFVLVEVIVAMVLLAVAVSSLAALVYSVSRSGLAATGSAYRNGVLMQEVNRLETLPYDSVRVGSFSTTVTTPPYPHTRVVTVTETAANLVKSVKVVVTPANLAFKPDTVVFTRTKARTSKVLCTDCPEG
ncbi:MAG TPA: prepilin-type N-terminal cleavage/methylation domain-containing protein [Gemmatimonadaceae bacterium]|nr:prepilin-type N-terminal cleavage/methylation domain-containing protein [Gemmatimonadaceae bacterium]